MSITAKRCWIHRRSTHEPAPWPTRSWTRDWRISRHRSQRACSRWKSLRQSNHELARRTQPISPRNVSNQQIALQPGPTQFSEADEHMKNDQPPQHLLMWSNSDYEPTTWWVRHSRTHTLIKQPSYYETSQQTNYSKFTTNFQTLIKIYSIMMSKNTTTHCNRYSAAHTLVSHINTLALAVRNSKKQ